MISWAVAISSESAAEKQYNLIREAAALTNDGIYILAVPLLEEAAEIDAAHTIAAEEELKRVYLALIDKQGFRRKYTSLLEKQMSRRNAHPDVFAEMAEYYLGISRIPEALETLKAGIEKTGSNELVAIYESSRYAFELSRTTYGFSAAIYGSTVQVETDGLWGIARADGTILIPCQYDTISTFSAGRAIVRKGNDIYAVDRDDNRVAVLSGSATGFGNFADNRIPLLMGDGWRRATGDFIIGTTAFEEIGMYCNGYAAAKSGGKWGVVDLGSQWLIPAEYDEIIMDELGRCYARGAVFARRGDAVYLIVDGMKLEDIYEDAHPFSSEGYAAVKRNGKWGFIDTNGVLMIQYTFDDALSFGQHLAAVKTQGYWGYISLQGHLVIEAAFLEAKSFSDGSAPVLTERGWQFISLLEFKKGVSL